MFHFLACGLYICNGLEYLPGEDIVKTIRSLVMVQVSLAVVEVCGALIRRFLERLIHKRSTKSVLHGCNILRQ